MKKGFSLALALLVCLASVSLAEALSANEYVAKTGYTLLQVTDIFQNEDAEPDENGDFPDTSLNPVVVQGCFGDFDMTVESDPQESGFDEENTFSMGLADGCVIMTPIDPMNPVENEACPDLLAWFEKTRADYEEPQTVQPVDLYSFYATFELNDAGDLTRLEYCYFP